jgi:hypothetical protein
LFSLPEEWRRILSWPACHRLLAARLTFLLAVTLGIALLGSVAVYFLERHARQTEVTTVWDAFYFTTVQILTVSSSLKNPISSGGRVVNILLEFWGVIFVAGMTGSVVSFFLTQDDDDG